MTSKTIGQALRSNPNTPLRSMIGSVGGAATQAVVTITGNYVATAADDVIFADATSGNIVVTLPAANVLGAGFSKLISVKRIDAASENVVTVQRAGSDAVDAGTDVTIDILSAKDFRADGVSLWGIF